MQIRKADPSRISQRVAELGSIGAVEGGGVTRLGLTNEERKAQDAVVRWITPNGFRATNDAIGNLIARNYDGPGIAIGSHLDSVPCGGLYDGALGLVIAAEVTDILGPDTAIPLEVIAWTGEEGTRFGLTLMGSRAAYGMLSADDWSAVDLNGVSLDEATREVAGSQPDRHGWRHAEDLLAYIEPHMEQSTYLLEAVEPIGVVDGIAGLAQLHVVIRGQADHAGTTSPARRKDAICGASEVTLALEAYGQDDPDFVRATVGRMTAHPGAKNVIAGECSFPVDIRGSSPSALTKAIRDIESLVQRICERRSLAAQVDIIEKIPHTPTNPRITTALLTAGQDIGLNVPHVHSWAGHDAQVVAIAGTPTGMVFVRSSAGSHNPDEFVDDEDAALAAEVIAHAVERIWVSQTSR